MNEIESLAKAYERFVKLPWDQNLSGAEKVWFAIYKPEQERRLRLHLSDFEMATKRAHHTWKLIDLVDTFAEWMAEHDYRDAYFESPDDMELALNDYAAHLAQEVRAILAADGVDDNTVVAVAGLGSVFGLISASELMNAVADSIQGRMLVFFPGRRDGNSYRLLDARDGWNYLAIPISAHNEDQS